MFTFNKGDLSPLKIDLNNNEFQLTDIHLCCTGTVARKMILLGVTKLKVIVFIYGFCIPINFITNYFLTYFLGGHGHPVPTPIFLHL